MKELQKIKQKAKQINATIILPEANIDKRVCDACKYLLKNKLCKIVVFGKVAEFDKSFTASPFCQIIDIETSEKLADYANQLFELRKHKGLTLTQAKKLVKTPEYFACMMLKNEQANGMVAGANFSTAKTLKPALQIVKAKPGKSLITGSMLMLKKGKPTMLFGDVSLVENPTAEQLSEIAIANAEFASAILDETPRVALLSYSTKGSAESEMVEKVKLATKLAQKNKKFKFDGEMQADCALSQQVARQKGVKSCVGGKANVLIFPDLNAGNIGYKLTARLAGYTAVGPIMLNFNKAVNDLSRGCTVQEIINTVLITKLQIKR